MMADWKKFDAWYATDEAFEWINIKEAQFKAWQYQQQRIDELESTIDELRRMQSINIDLATREFQAENKQLDAINADFRAGRIKLQNELMQILNDNLIR